MGWAGSGSCGTATGGAGGSSAGGGASAAWRAAALAATFASYCSAGMVLEIDRGAVVLCEPPVWLYWRSSSSW
nr:hypothetical protein GCM10017745_10390 [Saccharothrix mutabilis subsp. capreolus]